MTSRVIGAVVAIAVAAVVVLQDDSGDVANDYDPRSALDYHAPDGFNADGRTSQVTEQNEDYEIGDGATGL